MRGIQLSILMLITMLMSINSHATNSSGSTHIKGIHQYTKSTAPGDIYIRVTTPAAECSFGYYILDGTPGKDAALSMLLSAYHNNGLIRISGHPPKKWRGSSSTQICEVEGVVLEN